MANPNTDPLHIAKQAERDLNSDAAKKGYHTRSSGTVADSATESGIDDSVNSDSRFPGSHAEYGSRASGAGGNREIPEHEGGGVSPRSGRPYKARDFEGIGGPEDKERIYRETRGGDDEIGGMRK